MTVSTTSSKHVFNGNGATRYWDFTFPVIDAEDILIFVTDPDGVIATVTANYSVDVANSRVEYPTVASGLSLLAAGYKITLLRLVALTQELDLKSNDIFNAETVEQSLDKLTYMVQQHDEQLARAVKYPVDQNPDDNTTTAFLASIEASMGEAAVFASSASTSATNALASENAAATSATNAGTSATAAASSASAASTSASGASTSASAASTSASGASTSATNASSSATAAASSATSALSSKNSAETAATNAASSASAASTSASGASTSATNAASSATAAGTSATNAAASASAAATSETNAGNSASSALTSKNAAQTAASNAATSETNAGTFATNASTSATNASSSATSAATSATNASNSASAASTSATNAGNSATAAATSATNAGNSATAAATSETNTTNLFNSFPVQTGHSGEYLQTNGTAMSWQAVTATAIGTGDEIQFRNSTTGGLAAATTFAYDPVTGRLGIGTTATPASLLELAYDQGNAEAYLRSYKTTAAGSGIRFDRARGNQASPTTVANSDLLGQIYFRGYDGSNYRIGAGITAYVDSSGTVSTSSMPSYLTFLTTPNGSVVSTERLRIDSSGNVGIGTVSPASKLHIEGTGSQLFTLKSTSDVLNNLPQISLESAHAGNGHTAGEIRFRTNGTSGGEKRAAQLSSVLTSDSTSAVSGALVLYTTNAGTIGERMRIDSSGNVGIGAAASAGYRTVIYPASGTTALGAVAYGSSGAVADFFSNNGGTFAGSISVNSATTTYGTSSDYRLKQNLEPLTGALDRLAQLPVWRFNWNSDQSNAAKVDGFMAHEAQSVVPNAVIGEKDAVNSEGAPKYQTIDLSKLVPLLTAAIKELKAENDVLKARMDAWEA